MASHLIEIAFRGNRREFFHWDGDDLPAPGASVIVEADRGEDLGRVHSTGERAALRARGLAAEAPIRRALRAAGDADVQRAAELAEQNEAARRRALERVKANGLVMKISDAEWQWDRKKLTLYFTAEKRVDFRTLVRELAATFRTRIELKQIGVRDEAKRLDGVGRCGRQYCSSSWLPELRPVNLGVAKDQRLSLNPTQISGACGRLMCCLRYEHEFYVQSRKRFPKEGRILATARGEEKVVANDIFTDRVTLRSADGETRVVALAELRREMSGETLVVETDAPDRASEDHGTEGELELESPRRPARRPLPTMAAGRRAATAGEGAPRGDGRTPSHTSPASARPIAPTTLAQRPSATTAPAAPSVSDGAPAPTETSDDGIGDGERRRRRRGRRGGRRRGGESAGGEPAEAGSPETTSEE